MISILLDYRLLVLVQHCILDVYYNHIQNHIRVYIHVCIHCYIRCYNHNHHLVYNRLVLNCLVLNSYESLKSCVLLNYGDCCYDVNHHDYHLNGRRHRRLIYPY